MARKKTNWTRSGELLFAELADQGLSSGEIAERLTAAGEKGASRSTVGRRLQARLGSRRTGRVGEDDPNPVPDEAGPSEFAAELDAIPEDPGKLADHPVERLDKLIVRAEAGLTKAERLGNLPAQAAFLQKLVSLSEARRKAAPPVAPDPNAFPDLVAAAASARALLRRKLAAGIERAMK